MILKVARLGHPVLRQVAKPVPVEAISTPAMQQLIDSMIETMHEYDGVGLAAPQVHVSQQIFVMEVPAGVRHSQTPPVPLSVYINPQITPLSEEQAEDWEGCLSIPDLRGLVPRYTRLRLRAYDREGKPVEVIAEGFHARVIQHEVDHLQGHVYLDRMRDLRSLAFLEEFIKYGSAD
ncbi:MAG: peptide deformylase [Candidatus Tectimicrobiota bacterium]|nr:MAG: peptide deformylase [Candidatus Tectomicrobia bacterium]